MADDVMCLNYDVVLAGKVVRDAERLCPALRAQLHEQALIPVRWGEMVPDERGRAVAPSRFLERPLYAAALALPPVSSRHGR